MKKKLDILNTCNQKARSILQENELDLCGTIVTDPLVQIKENISTVLEDFEDDTIIEYAKTLEETDQILQYINTNYFADQLTQPKQELPIFSEECNSNPDIFEFKTETKQDQLPHQELPVIQTNQPELENKPPDMSSDNLSVPRGDLQSSIPVILIVPPDDDEELEREYEELTDDEGNIFITGITAELELLKYHPEDTIDASEMKLKKIEV